MAKLAQRLDEQGQVPGRVLGLNSSDPLWLALAWPMVAGWLIPGSAQPRYPGHAEALTLYLDWQDKAKGVAPLASYDEVRAQFMGARCRWSLTVIGPSANWPAPITWIGALPPCRAWFWRRGLNRRPRWCWLATG
ncbi:MAG: hypothetical protein U0401_29170 [Anaerolineae bacterium]